MNTGAGNTSIVDNATGVLTVNANASVAGRTLTLTGNGSGAVMVANLAENIAASGLADNLTVTTKTTSLSIAAGTGVNTIDASLLAHRPDADADRLQRYAARP